MRTTVFIAVMCAYDIGLYIVDKPLPEKVFPLALLFAILLILDVVSVVGGKGK